MAITVAQSTTIALGANMSQTITLNGVASGNALIFLGSVVDTAGSLTAASGWTVTDGTAYTHDAESPVSGGASATIIASRLNVNSGSHTVTFTVTGGLAANKKGGLSFLEISGLLTSGAFDKSSTNSGNSTTPTTGSTAALAQSNEIIVCALATFGSLTGGSSHFPPIGGPGVFTALYNGTGSDHDYQIQTSGTTAVSADWGTVDASGKWSAAVATYKGSTSGGFLLSQLSNQGGF